MAFLTKSYTSPFTGFIVQRPKVQKSYCIKFWKCLKPVCNFQVLHWCRKTITCPIVVTTCLFSCWNLIQKRFAIQLYLFKSHLKLLFYYPFISYATWLLEYLLTSLTRLANYVRVPVGNCKVVNHRQFLSWIVQHFHLKRTTPSKLQKDITSVEETCNTFEQKCLNRYEEKVNNYDSGWKEETSTYSNKPNNEEQEVVVHQKESVKEYNDRLYSYLLEAKRNIDFCLAERSNLEALTKNESSPTIETTSSKKERWLFMSSDVMYMCETIAGRVAMPALLLCFLREYFEPGHPMLTSQILSLLPLQVYGDIAPSGYNPYITYISGLVKSEAQTRVGQLVHVVFNLVLSSLFAKWNIATNILKILLGT